MPLLRPGTPFGKYQIVGQLDRGAMAVVYRAYQPSLGRHVALKVLADHLLGDDTFVRRFQNEARTAASLEHPNIVPTYEVDRVDGVPYIAMRLIEGQSLARYGASAGPLPLPTTIDLLAQVADALDFAHARGVVHRDVKPSNILLDTHGRAYLMDFGIARAGDQTRLTRLGALAGTPAYMAPEVVLGHTADASADRYALGIIAFELLAGREPFQADSEVAVLHAQAYEAPPLLRGLRPDLPPAVEAAVLRMLDKDPARRWPSCKEFIAAFEGRIGASISWPRGTRAVHQVPGPRAGRTWAPALAAVAALLVVGGAIGLGSASFRRGTGENSPPLTTSEPPPPSVAPPTSPPEPTAPPTATEHTPTPPPALIATIPLGHSVQGQPLEALRVGNGSVRLGVVGNMAGGQFPTSFEFLRNWADALARGTEIVPSQLRVYVLPTMNPDDLRPGTGFNARGVDLNRNFPPNWVSETCGAPGGRYGPTGCKRGGGGTGPFSEPESQAVRTLVERERLDALLIVNAGISVISSRDGGGGRGEPLARELNRVVGVRYVPTFTQYPVTGQLVDWVEDVGLIGVEVNMPRSFSYEQGLRMVHAVMDYVGR